MQGGRPAAVFSPFGLAFGHAVRLRVFVKNEHVFKNHLEAQISNQNKRQQTLKR
jgi:hypothetical protein